METRSVFLPRWMSVTLAASLLAIVAGGAWYYQTEYAEAHAYAAEQITTIARLKTVQIAQWRRDRLLDARELSESPFLAAGVAAFLADPEGEPGALLRERLASIQRQHDYADVMFLDAQKQVRLSLSGIGHPHPEIETAAADAWRLGTAQMSDLQVDPEHPVPHLSVVAPIFARVGQLTTLLGAIVVVNDASTFLYPLIQTWPTPSASAETLLVRRDGADVLFLNDLRHRSGAALTLRIPLTRTDVPSVMAVLGKQGAFEGNDYRGVEVVSVVLPVPDSPWFMVGKVDSAEVYAEWRRSAAMILLLVGSFVIGVFSFGLVAWQRGSKKHYQALLQSEAALRATVERHSTTLRSIGDAVIATDAQGRIELLNPVAEILTGWTQDDAQGKPLAEVFRIVSEETRAEADDPVAKVLRDGLVVMLANHTLLIARDGTERPIADSGAPILADDGQVIGVVLVFRDQTAERAKEQALRDSEEKFRALFESSSDAILLLHDGAIIDCNQAAVRVFGASSKADLAGVNPKTLSPERQPDGGDSDTLVSEYYRNAVDHGSVAFEWTHRRTDTAATFPAEVLLSRISLGHRVLVQGTVRDITERKRMQQAIERRIVALTRPLDKGEAIAFDELFDLVHFQRIQDEFAEATGVASIITRPDGTPITRPSNFTRLCSQIIRQTDKGRCNCYASDAAIGRPSPDGPTVQPCLSGGLWDAGASITVGDHHIANWLIGQVRDTTQTEEAMRVYAREIGADEVEFVEAFREVPAMSRDQFRKVAEALHTLASELSTSAYQNVQQARFIAERAQAETDRERLQGQLLQAQKMESVGRLAGGVAHDFNNMLGAILGYAEMAMEKVGPGDPLYNDLLEIQKAGQRSADLTRQLLAFARKQTIAPRVLDLDDTVAGLLKMLRRLIGEDVDLVMKPGAMDWAVRMDPSQINQLLANTCVNARDAIAGVGTVTIETGQATFDAEYCALHPGSNAGEFVRLTVSDDGAGMSTEVMAHLFEPFFTTKGLGEGTGLGLAMVYGIVKQNDGFINVYSEPAHGTTINIYLPRYVGSADVPEPAVAAAPNPRGGETVLLVEDEAAMLRVAQTTLSSLGYQVLTAGTPGEALRLAEEHQGPLDLLLTDVILPEMNGRELALRLQARFPGLRCLFMSGYTANVIAHRGVLDEGVLFIQKPFSIADLAQKVRAALAAP